MTGSVLRTAGSFSGDQVAAFDRCVFARGNDQVAAGAADGAAAVAFGGGGAVEVALLTVLGSYSVDMDHIINDQLIYPKTTNFGPKPGGFNVLNVPNEMYKTPDQFWNEINKPFLDAALARGDEIAIATKPVERLLERKDGTLTGFGREMEYLKQNGYRYDALSGKMIKK